MEPLLISRLRDIINHIEILTEECVTLLPKELHDIDRQQAEIACTKLQSLHTRFSTELTNYFRLSTEPSPDDISMFSTIQLNSEQILIELTTKLKSLQEDLHREGSGRRATTSELPKLNLPEFSGDILKWQQFWDHFSSNIDSRFLPDVDKLLYLKASLTGEAKRVVEGLETTNKNYQIAISILKERYGKEHLIIDAHYAALYRIKAADTSAEDCRRVLHEIERHLRVLNSLGENTNHNHLRFIIMEKFPEEIVYEMKMLMKTDSIEDMRKQLEIIVSAREDATRIAQEKGQRETRHYTVETFFGRDHVNQGKASASRIKFQGFQRPKNKQYQNWKVNQRHGNYMNNNKHFQNKRKSEYSCEKDTPNTKKRRLSCIFCAGAHYNDNCKTVRILKDRKAKLTNRCYNCFSYGHQRYSCPMKKICVHCGEYGNHNRALCPKVCVHDFKRTGTMHTNTSSTSGSTKTVLQTAVAHVLSENNSHQINCRILMDSGSQRSYVTQRVATALNLSTVEEHHLSVFTFGTDVPREYDSPLVTLNIITRTKEEIVVYANVVPTIAQHVAYPKEELYYWKNECILADDGSLGEQVDILIGNDYYFTVMDTRKRQISENLFLVDSKLGWVLTGKTEKKREDNLSVLTYFQSNKEIKLNKPDLPLDNINLKNLWDLESIGITDSPNTTKEEEAMKNFNDNIKYTDRRYSVCWPWKENSSTLPTNLGLVHGRLINLLRRMDKDTLTSYDETIRNQLDEGIIEIVPSEEIEHSEHIIHYLPHHGVKTPGKSIRIVYDASAKLKHGTSLNECLRAGPVLLEDLTGLLIRFRSHKIAVTADVEKAFLQIGLQDDSKDVTRFLWLKDISKAATNDNIIHLRFCRVPFGVISSPFLLNATIKYHLMQSSDEAVHQVSGDIYVDNLVTGTKTTLQAITLYNNLKREFEKISMNLREWSSNSKEFTKNIPDVLDKEVVKVLGLDWNTNRDTIQLRPSNVDLQTTKRGILRTIASTYDPCGFVAPSLLLPKLFMQDLWKNKIKWDSKLSKELLEEWKNIYNNLDTELKEIPRYYTKDFESKENQLHCFTDASTKAYAAVVYVVNENGKGFVIGKSRLTPIKDHDNLKIPRLELLGMLIGSRLLKYVETSLQMKIKKQFLWTDSQIVIDWYNSNKLLTPFVSRRIEEIKQNKNLTVRYVPTELNPADVATRPSKTKQEKKYWLEGPGFLLQKPNTWPTNLLRDICLLTPEPVRPGSSKMSDCPGDVYQITNSLSDIQESEVGDTGEIKELKEIQKTYFPEETNLKETSLSRNLRLFKDEDGLLRCKGRFENAEWSFDMKYPILLPKDCDFTNKLIKRIHEDNYHVGANHTLSLIRKQYWIPQGKAQVQKILRQCTSCVKHGGGPFRLPPTPALPAERVKYSSPFTFTGLDYLGPILVKTENGIAKRWICLFTCLAVRAIHLEIVQDLSAKEGLFALRRMISTRGTPGLITSDNASQFKLISEILTNPYCKQKNIKWKFIPQLSPWFGGFYERLVSLVKHCMKRTLHKHLLNDSEIITVIKEIEAILNTRPLTCVDSEMVHILKPADFLMMDKCITTELPNSEDIPIEGTTTKQALIKGWKRALMVLEEFKDMFVNRYLLNLRERYQNSVKEPRIKSHLTPREGQIVQIKGDTKNREDWKVGKIVSLTAGKDGFCRVANVKVANKIYTRSITQLYPLEIEDFDTEEIECCSENVSQALKKFIKVGSVNNSRPTEIPAIIVTDMETIGNEMEMETQENGTKQIVDDITKENHNEKRESNTEIVNELNNDATEIVDDQEEEIESRPVRAAATRALEKIREWTRNLVTLL